MADVKPAIVIHDNNGNDLFDAGETVDVISPESGKSVTFKIRTDASLHQNPILPAVQDAFKDLGLAPEAFEVGKSIQGIARFGNDVSAYYAQFVKTPLTEEEETASEEALASLQARVQAWSFVYAERVAELEFLPDFVALEKELAKDKWSLGWDSAGKPLNHIGEGYHETLSIPRLKPRITAVVKTLLNKIQATVTKHIGSENPETIDLIHALPKDLAFLNQITHLAFATGTRDSVLAQIQAIYTQLGKWFTDNQAACLACFDAQWATLSKDYYYSSLRSYLKAVDTLAELDIAGTKPLQAEANKKYAPVVEYATTLYSIEDSSEPETCISSLTRAILLRKKIDPQWEASEGLAEDILAILMRVENGKSQTASLIKAAEKAGFHFTAFQQKFIFTKIEKRAGEIAQDIDINNPNAGNGIEDYDFDLLYRDMRALGALQLIAHAKALAPIVAPGSTETPATPLNTKALCAQVHALLVDETYLLKVLAYEFYHIGRIERAFPSNVIREIQYEEKEIAALQKNYTSLLKSSAKRGKVYPNDELNGKLQPIIDKVEARCGQAMVYCDTWKEAAKTFAEPSATDADKRAKMEAIKKAAQEAGLPIPAFVDQKLKELAVPAPVQ